MTSRLIDSLATTDALADLFSDGPVLQAMLEFEAGLARAGAEAGVIPESAARAIAAAAARPDDFDVAAIARAARETGTPSIALVEALTERVARLDAASARYVHWGATSQDVSDSALVLLLKKARVPITRDQRRVVAACGRLSDAHAATIMLGRTLLQPATPITFGLKVAGWGAAVGRSWARVSEAWDGAMVLQFGGASGTRAALGDRGNAVARALAGHLGLRPVPPWHTDRDRLAALVAACGLFVASLGKIGRDVALLMQAEVAEVAGPGGGSSSMPHKRNPAGCAVVLANATRMPGLVASCLAAAVHEHERAVGGLHAEWPTIAAAVQATGAAVAATADVLDGLTVDAARMRANLEASRGIVFAERAMMLLTPALGKEAATRHVSTAVQRAREQQESFAAVLRSIPQVVSTIPAAVLEHMDRPEDYLGEAEALRRQLLDGATSAPGE
jgi:3-carboxy-cis,cis-muconate cycloisomerase